MSLVFKLCLHVFRHIVTNELPGVSRRTRSNWYIDTAINRRLHFDHTLKHLHLHTELTELHELHFVHDPFFFFLNKFTLLYSQYKNSFRGNFLYSFHRGLMVYRGNSVIFRTYEDERQRESIATFKNLDVDLVTFEPVSLLFFRVVTLHLFIIIENDSQFIFSNLKKKQLSLQFIGSAL